MSISPPQGGWGEEGAGKHQQKKSLSLHNDFLYNEQRIPNMIRLKIEGMSCGHCSKAVTEALAAVPGVSRVIEVSVERGEALVEGTPDPDALLAAVRNEGYQAELAR